MKGSLLLGHSNTESDEEDAAQQPKSQAEQFFDHSFSWKANKNKIALLGAKLV